MAMNDLDSAIEQSHRALDAILKGDPGVYQSLHSDAASLDVSCVEAARMLTGQSPEIDGTYERPDGRLRP